MGNLHKDRKEAQRLHGRTQWGAGREGTESLEQKLTFQRFKGDIPSIKERILFKRDLKTNFLSSVNFHLGEFWGIGIC